MAGRQGVFPGSQNALTFSQMVISLLLLNLAGGESVDDLRILDKDAGLCRVLRRAESHARGLAVAGLLTSPHIVRSESVRGIQRGAPS